MRSGLVRVEYIGLRVLREYKQKVHLSLTGDPNKNVKRNIQSRDSADGARVIPSKDPSKNPSPVTRAYTQLAPINDYDPEDLHESTQSHSKPSAHQRQSTPSGEPPSVDDEAEKPNPFQA